MIQGGVYKGGRFAYFGTERELGFVTELLDLPPDAAAARFCRTRRALRAADSPYGTGSRSRPVLSRVRALPRH